MPATSPTFDPTPPVYPVFPHPGRTPRFVIRRRILQGGLYLLTAATTFSAGVVGWEPLVLGIDADVAGGLAEYGLRGLVYMVAVLAVLTAHEAGHFVAAMIHGIPATLPFFLPVPVLLTGTLGAVIGMEGSRATRRELFDIAIAGPLAGLAIAIPALVAGMAWAEPSAESLFGLPLAGHWLLGWIRPDIAAGTVRPNALFMAGWVGLLVTGLNMMPMSQLDGGHVIYALFGERSKWLARSVLLAAMASIIVTGRTNWTLMVVLVTLIGVDHPPVRDEGGPIGWQRTTLGLLSLLIPVLTFMPEPLLLD